jgi:hypothetical protein
MKKVIDMYKSVDVQDELWEGVSRSV